MNAPASAVPILFYSPAMAAFLAALAATHPAPSTVEDPCPYAHCSECNKELPYRLGGTGASSSLAKGGKFWCEGCFRTFMARHEAAGRAMEASLHPKVKAATTADAGAKAVATAAAAAAKEPETSMKEMTCNEKTHSFVCGACSQTALVEKGDTYYTDAEGSYCSKACRDMKLSFYASRGWYCRWCKTVQRQADFEEGAWEPGKKDPMCKTCLPKFRSAYEKARRKAMHNEEEETSPPPAAKRARAE